MRSDFGPDVFGSDGSTPAPAPRAPDPDPTKGVRVRPDPDPQHILNLGNSNLCRKNGCN
jgi:hypothetical protein